MSLYFEFITVTEFALFLYHSGKLDKITLINSLTFSGGGFSPCFSFKLSLACLTIPPRAFVSFGCQIYFCSF